MEGATAGVMAAVAPRAAEHTYLNFADTRRAPHSLFASESYHRLRQIKAIVDPDDTIRSNHPIPPDGPRRFLPQLAPPRPAPLPAPTRRRGVAGPPAPRAALVR